MEFDAHSVFSPDGRLTQVEYAQNATNQGSLVTFGCHKTICVCYERYSDKQSGTTNKLARLSHDLNFYLIFSGMGSDGEKITDFARRACCDHFLSRGEQIGISILCSKIAGYTQSFTVDAKKRPFGARCVLFGFDEEPRIFVIEPDGNHSEYTRGAIGAKCDKAIAYLGKSGNICKNSVVDAVVAARVARSESKSDIECFLLDGSGMKRLSEEEIEEILKEAGVGEIVCD